MKNLFVEICIFLLAFIAVPSFGLAQAPEADFTASVTSGCAPLTVKFTDLSTNTPTSWNWDVGNGTSNVQNPDITYTTAGTYTVKLTAANATGSATITKLAFIRVLASPIADFSTPDSVGCAPLSTAFKDLSGGESSIKIWQWNFGDSVKSTLQNPVHPYSTNGFFNVSLTVTSANGCSATVKKDAFIRSIKPAIKFTNIPANGCIPFTINPIYSITSTDPVVSYSWDFGDGKTSTSANAGNTYTAAGVYTLKLNITTAKGCTQAVKIDSAIQVGNKVSVDFASISSPICSSQPVKFTSTVSSKLSSYSWNFGDGKTDTAQNPLHLYRDTGYFSVTLSANAGGCISSVTKANNIYIKAPVSIFDFSKNCTNRGSVIFNNHSIAAETYTWDFDDGSPASTSTSPQHTYTTAKDYSVKLMTTNSNGCKDTATVTVPIWFNKLDVKTDHDTICRGGRAVITMLHPSPSNIVKYKWFLEPNATIETEGVNNPIGWDYRQVGNFGFMGVAFDIFGCTDTVFKNTLVRVNGPTPNFDADKKKGCPGMLVTFKDQSNSDGLHSIIKWVWDFGDGKVQTFTAPPFTHVYDSAGAFTVKLTLTDASGCSDSYIENNFISTGDGKANFTTADSLTCSKAIVAFKNQSGKDIQTYLWDFGDGQTSPDENPIHAYTDSGLYTVKLKTTSFSGCVDSVSKKDIIKVKNPKAGFSFVTPALACAPSPISFSDSSYYIQSRLWYFGDGDTSSLQNPVHIYKAPSAYPAKLVVTSAGGCKDSVTTNILVYGVTGKITYSPLAGCSNLLVNYKAETNGAVSFSWDFNDGNFLSGKDSIVSNTYKKAGVYLPRVVLKDAGGCTLTVTGTDSIHAEGAVPQFSSNMQFVCDSANISFSNTTITNGVNVSYKWLFGDGATSILQSPVHRYNLPGSYSVKLIASTPSGCIDSTELKNYIKVVSSPVAAITGDSTGCAPASLTFTVALAPDTSAIASWLWTFGNGKTSTVQNPLAQSFTNAGSFNNTLAITNSSGCVTLVSKKAVIYPSFLTVSNDTAICKGDTIQLTASGGITYTWSSASSNLSCTNCAATKVYPATNEFYKVKATAASGCNSEDSVFVRVFQPFKLSVNNTSYKLCVGDKIVLQAKGAPSYTWSPGAGLSAANVSNPTASPVVNTTYKVIGYDSLGCFGDTAFVNINVAAVPTVNVGPDLILAPGTSKTLSPTVSSDVVTYSWLPVTDLSCSNCPNPVLTAKANLTYVLKVTNAATCSAQDDFKLITSCNNSNVFVPNTFSPNGDGMNDQFYPRGTGDFTISYMKIFNRWGETVFEKRNVTVNDPSQGWNGTYNGKKAADGVYTYYIEVICTDSKILKYIGNLTLIQ